jgi:putative transposase
MPSRYVIRNFVNDYYYHIFNRGVEKRDIFLDDQDRLILLYYLFIYLAPPDQVSLKYPQLPLRLQGKNLSQEINLVAYCLMPNHFHLLLQQKTSGAISKLLKQLTNAYTLYFNQKYQRVGGLVQGRFRAVMVASDELLLHVLRYIHLNPIVSGVVKNLKEYPWSSHLDYLGKPGRLNCLKLTTLSNFPSVGEYEEFILDHVGYAQEVERIKHLTLEEI